MSKVSLGKSFQCAFKGIFKGISRERSLKIHITVGLFIIIVSLILGISKVYFITILLVVFLIIILELFNKNFEKLIDIVSPEYNHEFGEIKDTMAGIVLMASILSVVIGILILYRPILDAIKSTSKLILILLIMLNAILIFSVLSVYYKRKK